MLYRWQDREYGIVAVFPFIASTNLQEHLDQAALRRFDLKVKFDFLAPQQAEALFARHGKEAPKKPDCVKVWRQHKKIDVLARIGEYVLLIEDKTDTGPHSNQLGRYYKAVKEGNTDAPVVDPENILPIYLKTGNESCISLWDIRSRTRYEWKYRDKPGSVELTCSYEVFGRQDFLKVLRPYYEKAHVMLDDFTDYLQAWEDKTKSFTEWEY